MDHERRRAAEAAVDAMDAFGVFNITVTDLDGADVELFVREPQFGRMLDQKMREEWSGRKGSDAEKQDGEEASGPTGGIRARAKLRFRPAVGAAAESPLRVRRGRRETVMISSTAKTFPWRGCGNFCA